MRRAAELRRAVDLNRRRARAGDAGAELLQELAELDDVRLAGGVADLRSSVGGCGGEQRRLRGGYRGFVQINRRRSQPVGHFDLVSRTVEQPRAHRGERLEVRRDRSARRKIAAG